MSSSSVGGCFLPGWTVTTRACYKAAEDPGNGEGPYSASSLVRELEWERDCM